MSLSHPLADKMSRFVWTGTGRCKGPSEKKQKKLAGSRHREEAGVCRRWAEAESRVGGEAAGSAEEAGPAGPWWMSEEFACRPKWMGRSHLEFLSRKGPNFISVLKWFTWLLWGDYFGSESERAAGSPLGWGQGEWGAGGGKAHSHTGARMGLGGQEVGGDPEWLPFQWAAGTGNPQLGPGSHGLHFVPIDTYILIQHRTREVWKWLEP